MFVHHIAPFLTDDFANSGEMLEPPSSPDQLSDPTDLSPEVEVVSPTFPGTVPLDTHVGQSGSSESELHSTSTHFCRGQQ